MRNMTVKRASIRSQKIDDPASQIDDATYRVFVPEDAAENEKSVLNHIEKICRSNSQYFASKSSKALIATSEQGPIPSMADELQSPTIGAAASRPSPPIEPNQPQQPIDDHSIPQVSVYTDSVDLQGEEQPAGTRNQEILLVDDSTISAPSASFLITCQRQRPHSGASPSRRTVTLREPLWRLTK